MTAYDCAMAINSVRPTPSDSERYEQYARWTHGCGPHRHKKIIKEGEDMCTFSKLQQRKADSKENPCMSPVETFHIEEAPSGATPTHVRFAYTYCQYSVTNYSS